MNLSGPKKKLALLLGVLKLGVTDLRNELFSQIDFKNSIFSKDAKP